jgi:hypothetical protein
MVIEEFPASSWGSVGFVLGMTDHGDKLVYLDLDLGGVGGSCILQGLDKVMGRGQISVDEGLPRPSKSRRRQKMILS